MALSTAHVPGDTGHISEHNTLNGFYNSHPVATTGVHGVNGNIVGDTDTQTLKNKTFQTASTGTVSLVVKGINSQTSDLEQWQSAGGTRLAGIQIDGTFSNLYSSLSNTPTNGGSIGYVNTGSASTKGLLIQGVTSQAANLTEWQDINNNVLASVSKNGYGTFSAITSTVSTAANGNTSGFFSPSVTSHKALVARAMVGQTGNLQEWQTNNGTPLAYIDVNGNLTLPYNNSWSPSYIGITGSTVWGRWGYIGNMVHAEVQVVITATSGSIGINLPVNNASASSNGAALVGQAEYRNGTSIGQYSVSVPNSAGQAYLYPGGGGGGELYSPGWTTGILTFNLTYWV